MRDLDQSILLALKRKMRINERLDVEYCLKRCVDYYTAIHAQVFKAIIFDYDLTIHNKHKQLAVENEIFHIINWLLSNNIIIGIATGNGEYIADEIRKKIDPAYHPNVIVGYYNGGLILPLNSDILFSDLQLTIPLDFQKIIRYVKDNIPRELICTDGIDDNNPFQLNFYSDIDEGQAYIKALKAFIHTLPGLTILQSPHSFDVIPNEISKSNVCDYLVNQGLLNSEILTMGDSGHLGGNDYDLLNRLFSLSVDSISGSLDNCWNFAPLDCRHLDATNYYLSSISIINGKGFMLKFV